MAYGVPLGGMLGLLIGLLLGLLIDLLLGYLLDIDTDASLGVLYGSAFGMHVGILICLLVDARAPLTAAVSPQRGRIPSHLGPPRDDGNAGPHAVQDARRRKCFGWLLLRHWAVAVTAAYPDGATQAAVSAGAD
jgi:hypothetical protein